MSNRIPKKLLVTLTRYSCFVLLAVIPVASSAIAAPAASIEVAFSPHRGATAAVVKLIGEAKQSIRVAAYTFTSKDIAKALMDAHKRGVDVQAVLDKSNATAKYTSASFLANVGVPTRIDYKYAIMHNKFIIVDDMTVETGSFNYSKSAEEKNAENVLILRNEPDVAKQYLARWQELWDESEEYKARY
jgi:phosphatidylserine/phosphatidylglycerophosphate/cardiolipin synthase-like enzyme